MTTKYPRTPITIQAKPDTDRDLIDWYESIGRFDPDHRQQRIKDALRIGIKAEQMAAEQDRSDLAEVKDNTSQALAALDDVYAVLSHVGKQPGPAIDLDGLAEDLKQYIDQHFAAIRSDLTRAAFALPDGNTLDMTAPIEPTPQVSADELDRRAANMRKSKW